MGGTALSGWEREQIVAMLREGKTLTAAALETGRSLTAVRQVADDYGIEYRSNPRIEPEVKERVRELLKQKASFSVICKETGVSLCTVRKIRREGTGGKLENIFPPAEEVKKPETAGSMPEGTHTGWIRFVNRDELDAAAIRQEAGRYICMDKRRVQPWLCCIIGDGEPKVRWFEQFMDALLWLEPGKERTVRKTWEDTADSAGTTTGKRNIANRHANG